MVQPLKLGFTLVWEPIRRFFTDGGADYAGNVAFLTFLAIFPFLIFLTALAAAFQETEAAANFIEWALSNLPTMAADAIEPIIDDVVAKSSGSLLTLSILAALWVSANAIEALRGGLNRAYGITRPRSYLFHRAQGALIVVLAAVAVLIATVVDILIPAVMSFLPKDISIPSGFSTILALGEYLFVPLLMIGLTIIMYRFLPDSDHGTRSVLPGALLAYGLWLLLAAGFQYYLSNFADYSVIYGSLGGVIVLLLFLYLGAVVFLIGAEFNVVWDEQFPEWNKQQTDTMRQPDEQAEKTEDPS